MQHRKPNIVHMQNGTYKPGRHGDIDANPEGEVLQEIPKAPPSLNRFGKQEWRRLCEEMIDMELLYEIDLTALEMACFFYGIFRELAAELRKKESLFGFLDSRTSQNNNVMKTLDMAYKNYTDVVYKMGVSPVERSRIQLEKKPENPKDNPFAASANQ